MSAVMNPDADATYFRETVQWYEAVDRAERRMDAAEFGDLMCDIGDQLMYLLCRFEKPELIGKVVKTAYKKYLENIADRECGHPSPTSPEDEVRALLLSESIKK